jgi:hypothetical protein
MVEFQISMLSMVEIAVVSTVEVPPTTIAVPIPEP